MQIFYQLTSFLTPGVIHHCDLTEDNIQPKVCVLTCLHFSYNKCHICVFIAEENILLCYSSVHIAYTNKHCVLRTNSVLLPISCKKTNKIRPLYDKPSSVKNDTLCQAVALNNLVFGNDRFSAKLK